MIKVKIDKLPFTSMYKCIDFLLKYLLCIKDGITLLRSIRVFQCVSMDLNNVMGAFGVVANKWISTKKRSAKFDEFIKMYMKVFCDTGNIVIHK